MFSINKFLLQCFNFPFTPALRDCVMNAKRSYQARLQDENKRKEEEEAREKARLLQERLAQSKEQCKKLKQLETDIAQVNIKVLI
jgi:hypothetical protein